MKGKVSEWAGQHHNVTDWELLNLFLPHSDYEQEMVWLVCSYVMFMWDTVQVRSAGVKLDQFFGYLTYKYRKHQAVYNV